MSDKKHAHILSELYAHPIAHNLEWRELMSALLSIGVDVSEENGKSHLKRNGHAVAFTQSAKKTLDVDEIMKLRHFLHQSSLSDEDNDMANDMIVTIDYRKAVIIRSPGTTREVRSEEHADLTKLRVLHKRPTSPPYSNVGPIVDDDYYDAVIKDMSGANRIVILSHGTGMSSAASRLMTIIHKESPDLARRIVAIKRCDLEAMTEPQLVALGTELLRGDKGL